MRKLTEITLYGRGGQGVVTAAQILALSAFKEGKDAQSVPSYGTERRGAPVIAYTRISEEKIIKSGPVISPYYVIVFDPQILYISDALRNILTGGSAVINTIKTPQEIIEEMKLKDVSIYTISANRIASEIYGKTPIPITNVAMLGAFCGVTEIIDLDSVLDSMKQFFPGKAREKNELALRTAFKGIKQKNNRI